MHPDRPLLLLLLLPFTAADGCLWWQHWWTFGCSPGCNRPSESAMSAKADEDTINLRTPKLLQPRHTLGIAVVQPQLSCCTIYDLSTIQRPEASPDPVSPSELVLHWMSEVASTMWTRGRRACSLPPRYGQGRQMLCGPCHRSLQEQQQQQGTCHSMFVNEWQDVKTFGNVCYKDRLPAQQAARDILQQSSFIVATGSSCSCRLLLYHHMGDQGVVRSDGVCLW